MSSKPPRKYSIGDPVIWTEPNQPGSGSWTAAWLRDKHYCLVTGYIQITSGIDDDYDLEANGPLYSVRLDPHQWHETYVAEVDLSPWPTPTQVVADRRGLADHPQSEPPVRRYNSSADTGPPVW
jgi:hypothetical protein